MEQAVRNNKGKPAYELLDYASLEPLVRVLMWGEQRHTRNNWRKPMSKLDTLGSLQRHVGELIDKVNEGQSEIDEETLLPILGHIMFNVMALSYHERKGTFIEYLKFKNGNKEEIQSTKSFC